MTVCSADVAAVIPISWAMAVEKLLTVSMTAAAESS